MEKNSSQNSFRLPVINTILATLHILWKRRQRFATALLIPTVVLLLVYNVAFYWIVSDFSKLASGEALASTEGQDIFILQHPALFVLVILVLIVLSVAAYVFYEISIHRLILLGDESIPRYGMVKWTWRETRFLLWFMAISILLAIVFLILFMLLSVFILPFANSDSREYVLNIVYFMALIPVIYLFYRLSLILPAVAVDEPPNFGSTWDLGGKNGWRLVLVVSIFPAVLTLTRSVIPIQGLTIASYLLDQLIIFLNLTVGISALSVSYQALSTNGQDNRLQSDKPAHSSA